MRLLFFKPKVAKGASYVKPPIKNQTILNIKNRDELGGIYSTLTFSHPPIDNPNQLSNYMKFLPGIKTDWIDLTDSLKVDDFEKLEKLNSLNINVFVLKENKIPTQTYVSKNWTKMKTIMETIMRKTIKTILIMSMSVLFRNVKRHLISVCIKMIFFESIHCFFFKMINIIITLRLYVGIGWTYLQLWTFFKKHKRKMKFVLWIFLNRKHLNIENSFENLR